MNEIELDSWVLLERNKVRDYLISEGIHDPNIGDWPAFEFNPYFAIWAIESKSNLGHIGWWAFSGDCPTDYISGKGISNPKEALKSVIEKWKKYSCDFKKEKKSDEVVIGNGNNLKEIGILLERRIFILENLLNNNSLW